MDITLFEKLLRQNESETLDFKREFPTLENDMAKSEFIKDILAFYNTPRTTIAYILYGVEDNKGVPILPPKGMAIQAPHDEATIQQIVKDKADPRPEFSLTYFDYEGKHFAALKIPLPTTDKPARVVKDFGKLKQNDIWRRVGSSSSIAVMADDLRTVEAYFAEHKMYVALQNYTQKLAKEYDGETIMQEENMTLHDVYIEPKFGVYKGCLANKEKYGTLFREPENDNLHTLINSWVEGNYILNNIKVIDEYLTETPDEPILCDIEVKNENVILLLGSPGQGKTSFCKRLLYDYYQNKQTAFLEKPVFLIKFRRLTDVERLIYNPLDTLFDYLKGNLPYINRPLFNKSLLVLDGLDELMITERLSYKSIDQFCHNILRNAEGMAIKIIITSRYHVDIENLKNNCLILSINPLTLTQQQNWLQRYLPHHPECKLNAELVEKFYKNEEYEHIKELITQPILLHMVATIYTGKPEELVNYANRAMVYDQLFTQLIERKWAKEGQIAALQGLQKEDLRRLLQEIALAIFQSGREYLHKTELESLIKDKKLLPHTANNHLQENAVKGLMMAAYMRETEKLSTEEITPDDRSNYGIEFMHKSLQEYLTAEKMWTEVFEEMTETKRRGGYVINEPEDALKIFHHLFGKRAITWAIADTLKAIIALQPQEYKTKLANRMKLFLPALLQRDFLYEYQPNNKNHQYPLNMGFNTCYGYWYVLMELDEEQNYLVNVENKERLLFLLLSFIQINGYATLCFSWQDLIEVNYFGAYLHNADLSHANLNFAYLSNANLNHADLSNANLNHAYLSDANLSNADLSNAYLSNAYLSKAKLFEANLSNVNLRNAILVFTNLRDANLRDANLSNADIRDANLRDANLSNANLQSADLSYANLSHANLNHADLQSADLSNANLQNVNLRSANLLKTIIHYADLSYADLSGVDLSGANLMDTFLQKAKLNESNLSGLELIRADLNGANLSGANLSNAYLKQADLSFADLTNAQNLTYEQLTQVKTLYNCIGLDPELQKRLLETHPNLFDESSLIDFIVDDEEDYNIPPPPLTPPSSAT